MEFCRIHFSLLFLRSVLFIIVAMAKSKLKRKADDGPSEDAAVESKFSVSVTEAGRPRFASCLIF